MKKRVFNLSHNFLFEKNNNNNPYIYIGLCYKRYGWVMCNERDRLGGKLIQIQESQQTQMFHDSSKILFQANVYDSKKFKWIERQNSISILKSQSHFIKMSTNPNLITDGATAISLQAAINIKDSLGLKVLAGYISFLHPVFFPMGLMVHVLTSFDYFFFTSYIASKKFVSLVTIFLSLVISLVIILYC